MKKKIKVLIAEDSPVVQLLLRHVLNADPDIEVIGAVPDGQAAIDFMNGHQPDLILMDIHMPNMDGFEATRQIMKRSPLPIVICSATMKSTEVENTFMALEAGALAAVDKPVGVGHPNFRESVATVLRTIKDLAAVRITRPASAPGAVRDAPPVLAAPRPDLRCVVIGASTGGPPVLHTILSGLPRDFRLPVLIVQHIATGFLEGMVEWLRKETGREVHVAADGDAPRPGHVYIAPDGAHMGLTAAGRIALSDDPPEEGLRPAVSHLFRTAGASFSSGVIAVLLTGMGRDGAAELKALRQLGAVTIAQDKASSVVHGMAGEAVRLDAAMHVVAPEQIAPLLLRYAAPSSAGVPPQPGGGR